jgi:hypothetical protein
MRRNLLKFPADPRYRQILKDNHEWVVITDTKLRILAMTRGERGSINIGQLEEAYSQLNPESRKGLPRRVYYLHSHTEGDTSHPSVPDIRGWVYIKKRLLFAGIKGFIEAGYGVIGKDGITLVKLPESKLRLLDIETRVKDKYHEKVGRLLHDKTGAETVSDAYDKLDYVYTQKRIKILNETHARAFQSLRKEEPESLRVRSVRRVHRSNMRRWR